MRLEKKLCAKWEEKIPKHAHTKSHKYVYSFVRTLRDQKGEYGDIPTFMSAWAEYAKAHTDAEWIKLMFSCELFNTG